MVRRTSWLTIVHMSYALPVVTFIIPDFVYLIFDILVIFETLICGKSDASARFIHYRPTCSEILLLFYISLYVSLNYISYCLCSVETISLVELLLSKGDCQICE